MTELEVHTGATAPALPAAGSTGANLIREAAAVMADAHALASAVAGTQMIPKHFQGKPDECAAAMLYGASLGLDPMQSVRQIYVVHGQAALYARAMSALVQGAGHEVWTVESTDQSVTVAGRRRGAQGIEQSTWTYDRAHKAGYTSNAKYGTDPQAMLYSKALSEVCRKIAPDVLSGVYTVEELQMERWDEAPRHVEAQPAGTRLRAALAQPAEPVATPKMTPAQQAKIFALLSDLGVTDDDQRRAGASAVLGREVESFATLTPAEASALIESLVAEVAKRAEESGEATAADEFGGES